MRTRKRQSLAASPEVVGLLRDLDVFAVLSADQLARLGVAIETISVSPGTEVVREGRIPTHFFVIRSGIADVWSTGEGGDELKVASLQESDYFGEIGLVEGMPSTATVRANTQMDLLRVPAAAFLGVVRDSPATVERLVSRASGKLAATHPSSRPAAAQAEADLVPALEALVAAQGAGGHPPGFTELLRSITSTAMNLFEAAACSLALLDGDELVFQAASGEGAEGIIGRRIPADAGIAGAVVRSGAPIYIPDVVRDARFAAAFAESTGYRPTIVVARPLATRRDVLGVIEVLDPARFDEDQGMTLLALFAGLAGLAIESGKSSSVLLDQIRGLLDA
jgi:CRP-like cAMP-binding protein/putative methionine-R-sulfoxide reductase with GAF domain